ncbi:addiction module protein [Immundisolibacter sp.]
MASLRASNVSEVLHDPTRGRLGGTSSEPPAEDRARLLERLIASFEPKSPAQAAWIQIAQRRPDDVRAGRAAMLPGDKALARVRGLVGRVSGPTA